MEVLSAMYNIVIRGTDLDQRGLFCRYPFVETVRFG